MKFRSIIVLSVLLILACSKDDENTPAAYTVPLIDEMLFTYGVDRDREYTLTFFYDELDRIERVEHSVDGPANFMYNALGKLERIDYLFPDVVDGEHSITFTYEEERIVSSRRVYSNPVVTERITLIEYSYTDKGFPKEMKRKYNIGENDYTSKTKIEWENGNPVNTKFYNDGDLELEFDITYDDQNNSFNDNLYFFGEIKYWATNNQIRSIATDYTGTYDPSCFDCKTEYSFGEDGFTEQIAFDWQDVEIRYQ